ncbi:hypothetical protein DSO57_1023024 [Entomophthora muscae]|uniref:Uncharacterized protein n=1 Tax=Entomophthora muscae TaxID=34485 RepID=A0ACC2UC07_9FUNG|nr:hypothetical protein DSO57_1023024 [Entomophthora muscae]
MVQQQVDAFHDARLRHVKLAPPTAASSLNPDAMGDPSDTIVFPSVRERAQLIAQGSNSASEAPAMEQPRMATDFSGWVKFGSDQSPEPLNETSKEPTKRPPPVPSKPPNLCSPTSPQSPAPIHTQNRTKLKTIDNVFTSRDCDSQGKASLHTRGFSPISSARSPASMSFGESHQFVPGPGPQSPKESLGKFFLDVASPISEINPFDDEQDIFSYNPVASPDNFIDKPFKLGSPQDDESSPARSPSDSSYLRSPINHPSLPPKPPLKYAEQQTISWEEALDVPIRDKRPPPPPKTAMTTPFPISRTKSS